MLHSLTGTTPHFVLETCAYVIGARVYWRAASSQSSIPRDDRLVLLAGAILGALFGSKLLHIAEHLTALLHSDDVALWLAGKSLVGGLLGGTLGVEIAKRATGWNRSTGDAWVPALAVAIIVGRLGCQLSGFWDLTYGTPTGLPWAWDYGDGIGRHPAALYEMILVAVLWAILSRWTTPPSGSRFAGFLFGYCAIRFALEFLKPPFGAAGPDTLDVSQYAGLTAIQWACLAGMLYFLASLRWRAMRTQLHEG